MTTTAFASKASFDSRDVIARIAELELDDINDENVAELAILRELVEDQDASDWQYGEQFIADWAFEDYARELAEDIGAIDPKAGWPLHCIDWEQAARELRMDYSSVELEGTTFWYRS